MARLFDDAQSEYLEINQAVLSGTPLAMTCRFNSNDEGALTQSLMGIFHTDSNSEILYLGIQGSYFEIDHEVRVAVSASASWGIAKSTAKYTINTWHHICGLFVSSTDRRVLLDGGNKGTNTTNLTPAGLDITTIGVIKRLAISCYMSGQVAEAAIWDLSNWPGATASDKADNFERIIPSLAKGFSPLFYPLGLIAYWPLVRGINDKVGGFNMIASGTVVSPHPRIILPQGAKY